MTKATKLERPKILPGLATVNLEDVFDEEELELVNCSVSNSQMDHRSVEGLIISRAIIKNVSLVDSTLMNIDATDVIFDNCNLSNVRLCGGTIHRAEFRHCKLLGLDVSNSTLGNVLFENCHLNMSNFAESRLKQVHFEACWLRGSHFFNAMFQNIILDRCDLDDADFTQVSLKGIDISTCSFEKIRVSIDNLAGCEVSPRQAIAFAKLFGLTVKD